MQALRHVCMCKRDQMFIFRICIAVTANDVQMLKCFNHSVRCVYRWDSVKIRYAALKCSGIFCTKKRVLVCKEAVSSIIHVKTELLCWCDCLRHHGLLF